MAMGTGTDVAMESADITLESQILGQQNLLSQYYSLIIGSVVGALYTRTLDPSRRS